MEELFGTEDPLFIDYYDVIGCHESSSVDQILAEYKLRARACHPDKNSANTNATKEFAQLQAAKEVLTDPEKKKDYDLWRGSGIKIPYTKWKSMRNSIKTSMHWAARNGGAMLEYADQSKHGDGNADAWNVDQYDSSEELRRKFRNYEI